MLGESSTSSVVISPTPQKQRKSNGGSSGRQASIMEMFGHKAKRKSEAVEAIKTNDNEDSNHESASPDGKRARIHSPQDAPGCSASDKENEEPTNRVQSGPTEKTTKVQSTKPRLTPAKCRECKQLLEDIALYPGDPSGAEEEFVVLTHDSLSVFVGNEDTGRPQHKITDFCVYDKNTHLCSFDAGLIEKNIELYFSGVVKPVYDEDSSTDNGVPGKRFGPINEWWTAGFDGGERALVGFSTAFAEYFLMEPAAIYQNYWTNLQEKIYMSKNVIEFLSDNPAAVYEDLVNRIQTAIPPASLAIAKFTEDSLLRHAQFVVEQVESYDSARTEAEDALIGTPCMRDLIHLAGVTLGKRRAARNLVVKEKKHVKASSTKATTTRLVAEIMEQFFQDTVDSTTGHKIRRHRCGTCEVCLKPDCGECSACKDMVKFGGSGRSKQACVQRKCPNLQVHQDDSNMEDVDEEKEVVAEPSKPTAPTKSAHKVKRSTKSRVEWIGEPVVKSKDQRTYYQSFKLGGVLYEVGDYVSVLPDESGKEPYVGLLAYMWETDSKQEKKREKMIHVDWFLRSSETVLQEAGDPGELFLVDECEDLNVQCVNSKVEVHHRPPHNNWYFMGGVEEDRQFPKCDGSTSFYYQKWYNPEHARFEDPPPVNGKDEPGFCASCFRLENIKQKAIPKAKKEIRKDSGKILYSAAAYNGVEYSIGDCVYLPPDAFSFKTSASTPKKKASAPLLENLDEDEYPEYYRKSTYVKGSNELVAKPFRIARIISIYCPASSKSDNVKLKVTKFYRPENTHKSLKSTYYSDLNLLYWSDEEATVDLSQVHGKCQVECEYDLTVSPSEYSRKGHDRFYFSEGYDSNARAFVEPPLKSRRSGINQMVQGYNEVKTKLTKITKKWTKELVKKDNAESEEASATFDKLRTLDVFSGCGGLSEGFHQAGIAESSYAIELWEPAAQAFRLNNPGATVFTEDCNVFLEMVMSGKEKSACGQRLPQKGDVDLLCGGPPCQGFSGMNRFNSREYSRFKNSLVVSYLSYCDYYRPRFFLLENVRNFVSFKNCMVLKLTLAALVKMGYQCTFGILQAGHYGVAQTRRRAIILAAAPGENLPLYPEPLHTFSARGGSISAQVGDKKITSNITRVFSAPFRTITVRDTMSDLPRIPNGHSKLEISYRGESQSHFQRMIRAGGYQDVLRDHICKDMSPLVAARMGLIPLFPGADWRDLPNKQVKLSDGTMTKLLRYEHRDKKQGKSSTGALRGVCACATGAACDPLDRQFNTLIPWCLPHTGNRHNHWAGLYGRLDWNGYFSTTVTNPEPMGKQGRVLHPEQDRVVSVRECARSQGFPDTYRFFGTIMDKHREVGNAVPPPMAKAIGLEIKKCLLWKISHESSKSNEPAAPVMSG
ncbi:unnamed protein product [Clavelina lepadiformis]|uniref:DNA (cytosine-5)-methyltransferase n=1 Tax=Clavelina lepadiformis TaxID=159417 RepID=A0ABP0GAQ6_CLALP